MSGDGAPPGRDEAIAVLWQHHRARLVRLAAGLTGDRAAGEEIVQDAFAALLGRWRYLRDSGTAHAYLQQVVVNQARGYWRAQRWRRHVAGLIAGGREQPVDPDLDTPLDMLAALGQLAWGKRACLVLRYYADLSEAQTAALLGVSAGTVKSQTSKGLRQLAAALEGTRSQVR
jgi:RNA polymerase sigma-70 factor (sigma-E family)